MERGNDPTYIIISADAQRLCRVRARFWRAGPSARLALDPVEVELHPALAIIANDHHGRMPLAITNLDLRLLPLDFVVRIAEIINPKDAAVRLDGKAVHRHGRVLVEHSATSAVRCRSLECDRRGEREFVEIDLAVLNVDAAGVGWKIKAMAILRIVNADPSNVGDGQHIRRAQHVSERLPPLLVSTQRFIHAFLLLRRARIGARL